MAVPVVDANLLLWAHHNQFPRHAEARRWWGLLLSEGESVALAWPVIVAFIRISTHPKALERRLVTAQAWEVVDGWLSRPNVWLAVPTERHRKVLAEILLAAGAAGNLVPDADLAALSVEWGLEVVTADSGFARFSGVRWRDPLR